ncbi:hypothetical protein OSB04_013227 [Centaurea solstitialis]|uniref:Uncharacterized protein n=1 Tax=Centaurea solstitialis TaxID=347529 RepID=A0AA38TCV2_9ASTR|nr:hypothetical protein OSB04_013227 [Centaurea solstitialis]
MDVTWRNSDFNFSSILMFGLRNQLNLKSKTLKSRWVGFGCLESLPELLELDPPVIDPTNGPSSRSKLRIPEHPNETRIGLLLVICIQYVDQFQYHSNLKVISPWDPILLDPVDPPHVVPMAIPPSLLARADQRSSIVRTYIASLPPPGPPEPEAGTQKASPRRESEGIECGHSPGGGDQRLEDEVSGGLEGGSLGDDSDRQGACTSRGESSSLISMLALDVDYDVGPTLNHFESDDCFEQTISTLDYLCVLDVLLSDLDHIHGVLCLLRNSSNLKFLRVSHNDLDDVDYDVGPTLNHFESDDCLEQTFGQLENDLDDVDYDVGPTLNHFESDDCLEQTFGQLENGSIPELVLIEILLAKVFVIFVKDLDDVDYDVGPTLNHFESDDCLEQTFGQLEKFLSFPLRISTFDYLCVFDVLLSDLDHLHGVLCLLRNSPNLKFLRVSHNDLDDVYYDVGPTLNHFESDDCLEQTFGQLEKVEINFESEGSHRPPFAKQLTPQSRDTPVSSSYEDSNRQPQRSGTFAATRMARDIDTGYPISEPKTAVSGPVPKYKEPVQPEACDFTFKSKDSTNYKSRKPRTNSI